MNFFITNVINVRIHFSKCGSQDPDPRRKWDRSAGFHDIKSTGYRSNNSILSVIELQGSIYLDIERIYLFDILATQEIERKQDS